MRIQDKAAFDQANVFGQGQANTAYAQYFIGNSYPESPDGGGQVPGVPGQRHL